MVRHAAFQGEWRNIPAIVNLLAQSMKITREWQFAIRAWNYNMPVEKVSAIFGFEKAFTNGTGFGDPDDKRRNYLLSESLTSTEDPQFDKARTCIRATHTGLTGGDYLYLDYMDGTAPPELKPGKRQPRTVDEINIEDYLYTPQSHPWMFFACNNARAGGAVAPFDHGALYPWFMSGQRMVTWMPLVSRYPLRIALDLVERVERVVEPYSP